MRCPLPDEPLGVAIVGSRTWPDVRKVRGFVAGLARKYPDAIVVSGGESSRKPRAGVDWVAELAAFELGLRVVSFRPRTAASIDRPGMPIFRYRDDMDEAEIRHRRLAHAADLRAYDEECEAIGDSWCVVRYDYALDLETGFPSERQQVLRERYDSFKEAAFARNSMIVRVAAQVVAYHHDNSGGTWDARRKAVALGKPVHLYEA